VRPRRGRVPGTIVIVDPSFERASILTFYIFVERQELVRAQYLCPEIRQGDGCLVQLVELLIMPVTSPC
jgi:hypothetical protein